MPESGRRITALDVARIAGVSKTTVSYVLNETPHQSIPEETRQRVLDAVRRLNYTPLSAARALRRGRTDTVLLVMPDWPLGRVLALIVDALTEELESGGLSLVIRRQRPAQPLDAMWRELTPAAVITLGEVAEAEYQAIRAAGIFVATGLLTSSPLPETAVVVPQDAIGALQVRHLAERGHRHLGYAAPGDPRFRAVIAPRIQGARRACHDLGIDEPAIAELELTLDAAVATVRGWQDRSTPITGAVAYNDEFAGALLAALGALGRSAPRDLAVIGVDNEPLARFMSPSLSTIDQNHLLVATKLARLVFSGLAGEAAPAFEHSDALSLIVREST